MNRNYSYYNCVFWFKPTCPQQFLILSVVFIMETSQGGIFGYFFYQKYCLELLDFFVDSTYNLLCAYGIIKK